MSSVLDYRKTTGVPPAPPPDGGDFGGGGGGGPNEWGSSRRAFYAGLIVVLAATAAVFVAFTGAYISRRGLGQDWRAIPLPAVLWLNGAVILTSSVFVELARAALRAGHRVRFNLLWTAGTALGVVFLTGQAVAWRQLNHAGIYLVTNPSSTFVFLLTAAHAAHLLAGLTAMVYVNVNALRYQLGPARRTGMDVTAVFWHFLAGLWIYLLALFSFWA